MQYYIQQPKETSMNELNYLITYINAKGTEEKKLVTPEALSPEGEPVFSVEGISIFNIRTIQPYL
jgi:hypothetical protein